VRHAWTNGKAERWFVYLGMTRLLMLRRLASSTA
jgi:hypothetical protein